MAGLRLVPSQGPPVPLEITKDRAIVGREPSCDVVVSDGSVSRKHAQLERRPNGWFVVDQGSANGTFVDSQRITEMELRNGHELRFGGMAFTVEIDGADDSATIMTGAPEATILQEAVRPPSPGAPGLPAPPPPPAVKPPAPPWEQAPKVPVPAVPPKPTVPVPPLPSRPAAAAVPPAGAPPALPPRAAAPPPPPPPAGGPPPLPPRPGSRPPVVAPVGSVDAPPPAKKARGPMFWAAGGCCGCLVLLAILAGVIGGGVWFATSAIVDAVRAQIADVKKGDMDAAYGRMSEGYRQANSRDEFIAFVERHPGLRQNTDSTFSNRNVSNDTGTVGGTLTGGGTTEKVTYSLVKESGAWKITAIDFEDGPSGAAAPSSSSASSSEGAAGTGGANGSGKLRLETMGVDKAADPPGHVVAIKMRATGFGTEGAGEAMKIDLVLDLETRGPGGARIPSLSRMELQSRDRPDGYDPPHVDFDVTVTLREAGPGDYTARLTVRDQMGRDIQSLDVPFTIP